MFLQKKFLLLALITSTGLVLAAAYENYACKDRCNLLYVNNLRRTEHCIKTGCS